jgi:hypothetical protein
VAGAANRRRPRKARTGFEGSKQWWELDGVRVSREEYDAALPSKLDFSEEGECLVGQGSATWPMTSEALAVHPSQVDAANERARRAGIGARYQKGTGVCQIDSPGEKTKLVRLEGFVDRQAGYR